MRDYNNTDTLKSGNLSAVPNRLEMPLKKYDKWLDMNNFVAMRLGLGKLSVPIVFAVGGATFDTPSNNAFNGTVRMNHCEISRNRFLNCVVPWATNVQPFNWYFKEDIDRFEADLEEYLKNVDIHVTDGVMDFETAKKAWHEKFKPYWTDVVLLTFWEHDDEAKISDKKIPLPSLFRPEKLRRTFNEKDILKPASENKEYRTYVTCNLTQFKNHFPNKRGFYPVFNYSTDYFNVLDANVPWETSRYHNPTYCSEEKFRTDAENYIKSTSNIYIDNFISEYSEYWKTCMELNFIR